MKPWFIETVMVGIEWLCILSGHVGGCWILNRSPLQRLWIWASDEFYKMQDYAGRHDCPYCGKDRPLPSRGHEWSVIDTSTTGSISRAATFRWIGAK